jgi:hypothetical protein
MTVQASTSTQSTATIAASGCLSGTASFSLSAALTNAGISVSGAAAISGPGVFYANYSISASSNVAAATYSGQLTVTIAGVSQPTPLTVTVLPPPQPSYTLYVRGSSTSLTQGGSFQEYVLLAAHNGYAGVPVLSAWTPPGISVSFSNNALETYGVVTATISASGLAALGTNTVYITGNDGTAYYTANPDRDGERHPAERERVGRVYEHQCHDSYRTNGEGDAQHDRGRAAVFVCGFERDADEQYDRAADASGSDHYLLVPFNEPMMLITESSQLAPTDGSGNRLPGDSLRVPFVVPAGGSLPPVTINVGKK